MSSVTNFTNVIDPVTATITIATDDDLTDAVDLYNCTLAGIFTPAALTSTTITFLASPTLNGTYAVVEDGNGNTIGKTVSANKYIPVDEVNFFYGIRFLKIATGSAEAADRVLTLIPKVVAT